MTGGIANRKTDRLQGRKRREGRRDGGEMEIEIGIEIEIEG